MTHKRPITAKGVIIIPNENIHEGAIWEKYFNNGYHQEILIEAIYEIKKINQLPNLTAKEIASIYNIDIMDLAYKLVELGFCLILYDRVDNSSTLFIYLPNQLGIKQNEALKAAITKLGEETLFIFELNESDELFDYYKEADSNYNKDAPSRMQSLMTLIDQKQQPPVEASNNRPNTLVRRPQNDKDPKNS